MGAFAFLMCGFSENALLLASKCIVTLLMENLDFMGSGDAVKNLLQPTGGS
jgi:hypothetical protein